jgi:hypothetical protein
LGFLAFPWRLSYGFRLSIYLGYLIPNSNRELKEHYEALGLDPPSRRRNRNTINFETDTNERKELRKINKGLTLEIFASGMISYFDHPAEVHANCTVTRHEMSRATGEKQYQAFPKNYAQGGEPDVAVDYGDYMVILEVSAKHIPSLAHFTNQLKGALKHARIIRESGYDKPIYCLVIEEDRSLTVTENKLRLEDRVKMIKPSEQIYLSAISIQEFSALGQAMVNQYKADVEKIQSSDLLSVLQATMAKGIHGYFDKLLLEHLEAIKTPSQSDWF